MSYTKKQIENYFEWDVHNWSKALNIWENELLKNQIDCLGIGERNGGLSLYLAQKGYKVICSDLENPKEQAKLLHSQYPKESKNISYEAINATSIPYTDTFDVVIFKSVLGGVGSYDNFEAQKLMINQIYKALRKGGKLFFVENLEGSRMHKFFRKKFVKWGSRWRYINLNEIKELFSDFSSIEYETCGYLGLFGRTNKQRIFLGKIDTLIFDKLMSSKKHYIIYGVAKK